MFIELNPIKDVRAPNQHYTPDGVLSPSLMYHVIYGSL